MKDSETATVDWWSTCTRMYTVTYGNWHAANTPSFKYA